jgi:hypothetical protein
MALVGCHEFDLPQRWWWCSVVLYTVRNFYSVLTKGWSSSVNSSRSSLDRTIREFVWSSERNPGTTKYLCAPVNESQLVSGISNLPISIELSIISNVRKVRKEYQDCGPTWSICAWVRHSRGRATTIVVNV